MSDAPGYDAFIRHSQNWLFDFPDTQTLRELLLLRLSETEAAFLSRFPHFPSTLEQLAARYCLSAHDLAARMQPLLQEGFIFEVQGRSATRFSLTDPLFFFGRMPGWQGKTDAWMSDYAPLMNQYYDHHFGADFLGHPTKGLRAVPVNTAIDDPRTILPYEDLLAFVDREAFHTVSACACRHNVNMDPDREDCAHDTEVCLHFGRLGKYIVKHGMGRQIEKKETFDILAGCADAGLVHAISNTRKGMDTICNCCSCCCIFLRPIQVSSAVQRTYHQCSNYSLKINRDTCLACGLCVQRCPIDAINLADTEGGLPKDVGKRPKPKDCKQVAYDPQTCIGCGVCVHKCPTGSLSLVRREEEADIPETFFEAGMRMMQERGKDFSTMF